MSTRNSNFKVKCSDVNKVKQEDGENYILENVDIVQFMANAFDDEHMDKFFNDSSILEAFAKKIGVKGLLKAFNKEEVCEHITWDYIRKYFMDHMNPADILDYIGWEEVSKHFKDYLDDSTTSKESINSSVNIMEKLNECAGED